MEKKITQTCYAVFDGHVFTPVWIEPRSKQQVKPKKRILQQIAARARDLGISDLADQHDHYLYGTEKRYAEIWEDFYDNLLIQERINEPRESLEQVKIKLQNQGLLEK